MITRLRAHLAHRRSLHHQIALLAEALAQTNQEVADLHATATLALKRVDLLGVDVARARRVEVDRLRLHVEEHHRVAKVAQEGT